jgi:hypothetical protein
MGRNLWVNLKRTLSAVWSIPEAELPTTGEETFGVGRLVEGDEPVVKILGQTGLGKQLGCSASEANELVVRVGIRDEFSSRRELGQ